MGRTADAQPLPGDKYAIRHAIALLPLVRFIHPRTERFVALAVGVAASKPVRAELARVPLS